MQILKEPLLHFAILGIGLFAMYRLIAGANAADPDEIVVDSPRIAALAEQFERAWRRPPTATEIEGLVESYVRDEVLYREGLALGLDRGDPVIKSRIRLKMEILGDGSENGIASADLQTWFDANADRYATPARYDLRQVYFDPGRHDARHETEVAAALLALQHEPGLDAGTFGDPTLLPVVLSDVTPTDVASQFGPEVAAALPQGLDGRWFGPVSSPYGAHLLRVELREPPKPVQLADVRDAVERDVRYSRAQTARDSLYARLRGRYTVRIEQVYGTAAALAAGPR